MARELAAGLASVIGKRAKPGLTNRQWQVALSRITGKPLPASREEVNASLVKFLVYWLDNSKTARELAQAFAEQHATPDLQEREGVYQCEECDHAPFRYPQGLGLHKKQVHGVSGAADNVVLPAGKHYIMTRRHAAERIMDLFGDATLTDAVRRGDLMYKHSVPVAKAKDGAWWYKHDEAYLVVDSSRGAPVLISVMPPSWNLADDKHGGDWDFMFGPEADRYARA